MEWRLDYCCDQLGYNKSNLAAVTVMDFVLDDVCRMDFVVNFPNLKELNLVNQGINDIEGIDKLKVLEKCWLNNNYIEVIRGFERLP